jgi:hypothetical protein
MSSTTTSSGTSFLSSSRTLWVASAVLVIGIGVFLGVFLSRGTGQPAASDVPAVTSPPASDTNPIQNGTVSAPKVKPSPAALGVARKFLVTAVARKNLNEAYNIVGPNLKGGYSRKEWTTGGNPVIYFPARNLNKPDFTVKSSTKNDLWLEVGLVRAAGSKVSNVVKSLGFQLEVQRIRGKWLVNYFMTDYRPPSLATPPN